ncbi:MAG: hypothetical protein OXF46_08055 [Rhodobacteraceae bacterium]|nr:hypothetical protein [Paracoccaceae bacterium]
MGQTVAADGARTAHGAGNGTAETKLIEVDFTYDLGGGATLKASIDKEDAEKLNYTDAADTALASSVAGARVSSEDTTTLEAVIAFSF